MQLPSVPPPPDFQAYWTLVPSLIAWKGTLAESDVMHGHWHYAAAGHSSSTAGATCAHGPARAARRLVHAGGASRARFKRFIAFKSCQVFGGTAAEAGTAADAGTPGMVRPGIYLGLPGMHST